MKASPDIGNKRRPVPGSKFETSALGRRGRGGSSVSSGGGGTLAWGTVHDVVIGKIENALIGMILEEEKGNQVRTAKRLGINRNTLRKKMKDLKITTRVITGFGER